MALDKLSEKYITNISTNATEIVLDMMNIFDELCDEGFCGEMDILTAIQVFNSTIIHGSHEIHLPKDFHPLLNNSINEMGSVIDGLNEFNLDETISSLTAIKEKIEDTDDIFEHQRVSVLSSVSVAIESTKLWHNVHYDENHPLHSAIKLSKNKDRSLRPKPWIQGERKLQTTNDLVTIINTDWQAVMNLTCRPIKEDLIYLALLPGTLSWVGLIAPLASIAAFFIIFISPTIPVIPVDWYFFTDVSILFP